MALMPSAHAAELPEVCYPTSVQCSEDKTELKKIYDLTPEADPKGIARSDFERDGYHYTLVELLRQELPQEESREHTETVSLQSAKKDMESVLAILPQEKEFITDDGLIGTLTLRLDTVQIEPSGYGSTTKEISAKRSYGNGFDATKYIDKFFDLQISIPRTNSDSFLRDRLHIGTDTVSTMVCHEVVRQFDFSLRQAERYARLIKIVATQFDRYDSIREENKAAIFAANYLVPFLIGLQMYDLKLYHEFLAGNNPGPMLSILANIVVMGCPLFLKRGEEFKPETKEICAENGETIPVAERLRVIYDALYGRADIWNGRDLTVGQMRFTDRTRAYIDSIVSMLFSGANYNFE